MLALPALWGWALRDLTAGLTMSSSDPAEVKERSGRQNMPVLASALMEQPAYAYAPELFDFLRRLGSFVLPLETIHSVA